MHSGSCGHAWLCLLSAVLFSVVFSMQRSNSSIVFARIRPENMENTEKISHIFKEDYSPSFFKTHAWATVVKKKVAVEKSWRRKTVGQ